MIHFQIVPKVTRLLMLYAFLAHLWDLAYADPPYGLCSNTNNYTDGSSFQSNLNALLHSLSSNTSTSKFYNTSTGTEPERVYGLHMCLNYVTDEYCRDCITTASQDILKLCPNSREAAVWEEVCQLRYSNQNFFGKLNTTGNIGLDNKQNISQPEQFKSVVKETLNSLTLKAAFNLSTDMYATGEAAFEDKTIYALVQCTRDLSADGCNSCLQMAITNISTSYYFSIGARLLSRSCFLRYELYDFYGVSDSSTTNGQGGSHGSEIWIIRILIVVSASLAIAVISSCIYCLVNKKAQKRKDAGKKEIITQQATIGDCCILEFNHHSFRGRNDLKAPDFPYIDFVSIQVATNNFSDSNKLGQGGFGPVYKGALSDGKEVAVKRLSYCSEQGSEEFTNEVLLIMKLQHKNLVRLMGFCVDGEEKLLVYEFMPNSSLDVFLFDKRRRAQLNWSTRLNIITGIARGTLYLHEDSRLRIIHRDLKASNVLLDNDMNPKISDFGMARIFAGSESAANTAKIVGTYGYMAPEYAMEGVYSVKSDVFSFGVLLIEIITGVRNAGFHLSQRAPSLLAYAWKLWNEGSAMELMDPLLLEPCCPEEFLRYLHIGLLCVQEDAYDRPTMSSVVVMLKNETTALSQPGKPAFSVGRFTDHYEAGHDDPLSVNGLSISTINPR
ncbi:Cysteine-rich receptor-like protein kinase 10 [Morella rubra]|uniref:Cysteine-rich receptor-like protein kinase 10 n=1 Tax=Morella rubra TaxID=262757 RepID=A0A6A1UM32_9ROSI|nr:Cysteine-rich receptor-like protein kinase 10 [Morella rubra]KAB1201329.1 Cysteine-rich receptor-like protein kinase 10 [Morella rubra]